MGRLLTLLRQKGGFSPTDVSGLALWLDASDLSTITHDAGAVSQWDDKSGNGYAFTQGTASEQPTTGATQNARNVLTFDGSGNLAASTASDWNFLSDGTQYTIFVVAKPGVVADPNALYGLLCTSRVTAASTGVSLLWDDRAAGPFNERVTHTVYDGAGTSVTNNTANGVMAANAYGLITVKSDSQNATAAERSAIDVNNGTVYKANTSTRTPGANAEGALRVGSAVDGSFDFVGGIAEIAIVGRATTSGEDSSMREYLAAKWGVTLA